MSGILVQMIMSCVPAKKYFFRSHEFYLFIYFFKWSFTLVCMYLILNFLSILISIWYTHTKHTCWIKTHLYIEYKQAMTEWKLPSVYQSTPIFTLLPHHISVHTPSPLLHSFVEFLRLSYGHAHLRTTSRVNGAHWHEIPAHNPVSCYFAFQRLLELIG